MSRKYKTPVFEKIVFDYKIQTSSSPHEECYESIMNTRTADYACDPNVSSPISMGWTKPQTLVNP